MAKPDNEPNGNILRQWFANCPQGGMNRHRFAQLAGVSHSYLTSLCSDTPPWPTRRVLLAIEELTGGQVRAADFLHMTPPKPRPRPRERNKAA